MCQHFLQVVKQPSEKASRIGSDFAEKWLAHSAGAKFRHRMQPRAPDGKEPFREQFLFNSDFFLIAFSCKVKAVRARSQARLLNERRASCLAQLLLFSEVVIPFWGPFNRWR